MGLEWLLLGRHEGLNGLCYFCNHPKHLLKPGKSFGFETAVLRGFISLECATKIGLCKAILGSVASKQSMGCSFPPFRVQQGDTRKRRSLGYWGCFGSPQDPSSSLSHLRPFDALDAVTSVWLWNIFFSSQMQNWVKKNIALFIYQHLIRGMIHPAKPPCWELSLSMRAAEIQEESLLQAAVELRAGALCLPLSWACASFALWI